MAKDTLKSLTFATIAISTIILIACIYLLSYHSFLIKNNVSTYKHIRRSQKKSLSKSKVVVEKPRISDDD